ncbi:zinc-type alcohol dehydrogenase [Fusarium mundagurra]|uniref:Zinc-type alcohol dehydrogenase n=1 Tax=Fusarium mundagurra TaxID=1567541 RepID=A0A8H5Y9X2_9HYPO|nr:zinc-type alcohol dehydrogenase [Fusarium mundagurra]
MGARHFDVEFELPGGQQMTWPKDMAAAGRHWRGFRWAVENYGAPSGYVPTPVRVFEGSGEDAIKEVYNVKNMSTFGKLFASSRPPPTPRMSTEIDPSNQSPWYECLQSDLFWVLTILIIFGGFWSDWQLFLLSRKNEGQDDTQSSATPPEPVSGINFKEQITSRLRQHLALLFCALPIPGELSHGLDVLKTIWRLSVWLVQSEYPVDTRPFLLGIIMFSPIAIPLLVACVETQT